MVNPLPVPNEKFWVRAWKGVRFQTSVLSKKQLSILKPKLINLEKDRINMDTRIRQFKFLPG